MCETLVSFDKKIRNDFDANGQIFQIIILNITKVLQINFEKFCFSNLNFNSLLKFSTYSGEIFRERAFRIPEQELFVFPEEGVRKTFAEAYHDVSLFNFNNNFDLIKLKLG